MFQRDTGQQCSRLGTVLKTCPRTVIPWSQAMDGLEQKNGMLFNPDNAFMPA
jgi:hypothetical protein